MKVSRRLAFHFTYQLIAFSLFLFMLLLTLFFVIAKHIANEEIRRNFPAGVVSNLTAETLTENGVVNLAGHWKDLLHERNMWLQVVDMKGNVIHATNTPGDVPSSYSVSQLLEIKEERRLGKYTMGLEMDLMYEDPLLFMLGWVDESNDRLRSWFADYQSGGMPDASKYNQLEQEIQREGGFLHIIDGKGNIQLAVGKEMGDKKSYHPLELMSMQEEPGAYVTNVSVYWDKKSGMTWVYHTPYDSVGKQPIMNQILIAVVWLSVIALVTAVTLSIWHGYRYSRPLLLFTGWFERMGSGSYEEVLTPKDRKKVFRKNGKLRLRYKLYKEVIHSFYHMAEKLAAIERERKRLEQNREEWMSGISHDLRTPLSSIQGYGYMLESMPENWSPDELREMGTVIREKGDYMLELIDDFSLVFRLKTEIHPQDMCPLDLNELVRRCVLKYVNDATLEGVTFLFEGADDPVLAAGSSKWLHRLMDNLISNAVKHNPLGVTVTVGVEERADYAVIVVKDNGVGMDEKTQRNLFERYYRGTNTEGTIDGSGLGMSIAKAIIEAHRGTVEIESEVGEGTCIRVVLPREIKDQGSISVKIR